jgi:hypothetical protein
MPNNCGPSQETALENQESNVDQAGASGTHYRCSMKGSTIEMAQFLKILLKKRKTRIKFISISLHERHHASYLIGKIRDKRFPFWLLWPRITYQFKHLVYRLSEHFLLVQTW